MQAAVEAGEPRAAPRRTTGAAPATRTGSVWGSSSIPCPDAARIGQQGAHPVLLFGCRKVDPPQPGVERGHMLNPVIASGEEVFGDHSPAPERACDRGHPARRHLYVAPAQVAPGDAQQMARRTRQGGEQLVVLALRSRRRAAATPPWRPGARRREEASRPAPVQETSPPPGRGGSPGRDRARRPCGPTPPAPHHPCARRAPGRPRARDPTSVRTRRGSPRPPRRPGRRDGQEHAPSARRPSARRGATGPRCRSEPRSSTRRRRAQAACSAQPLGVAAPTRSSIRLSTKSRSARVRAASSRLRSPRHSGASGSSAARWASSSQDSAKTESSPSQS